MEFIQITINNKTVFVRPESTILQACENAGVEVPRFCYHEKLSVAGNCRICLVEVSKSPKPVVSCAIPVSKGMIVFSDTPLVRKARESVLEFLLLNHPLDCPICDQGGECDLQDEALTYGSDRGRYFVDFKRSVEDKECGPIVKTIITRCIHCTRCVRFSTEIAGNEIMGSFGRGEETEIGTYVQSFIKTELSGNLVDLCPVGALTSKPYAYKARSWEVNRLNTIDLFDAVASDIIVYTRNQSKLEKASQEQIIAILPIKTGNYSENWISDRTRYAFDGLYSGNRKNTNINLKYKYPFQELDLSKYNKGVITVNVGSQINMESLYIFESFSKLMFTHNTKYTQLDYNANINTDFPNFYSLNKGVNSFATNPYQTIIIIGTNLRYDASLLNTRFRREFKQRGATYITFCNFNALAYGQSHKSNSYRGIISAVENRMSFVKNAIIFSNSVGIYIGVNNLRNVNSSFLQQYVRQIAKYFFTKTQKNDRFGYIHSSVGSLAFSHFNIKSGHNKHTPIVHAVSLGINTEFAKNVNHFNDNAFTSFSTHFKKENNAYITTSFYENTGHVISIENKVCKHNKVITPPSQVYSMETLINYSMIKYILNNGNSLAVYFNWSKFISLFKTEMLHISFKEESTTFNFNPFIINSFFTNYGKIRLFSQSVKDFYLDNPIASDSITRAECALFLKQDTNSSNFLNEKF